LLVLLVTRWSAQLERQTTPAIMTPSLTSRSHGVPRLQQRSQHSFAKRMKCKIEYELLSDIHS
jgi:hypothetical protein